MRWRALLTATVLGAVMLPAAFPAQATSKPIFPYRGVVEGFYGRPWSHDERMDSLAWMGAHGMNLYVHAPKDDPWQRSQWRDPYPPEQMAAFADEVRRALGTGVAWVPSLSPALPLIPSTSVGDGAPSRDICFSCPDDFEVLTRKLGSFLALGVRTLMLSFDDTQKVFTHPEDLQSYGTDDAAFGAANADLLNRTLVWLLGKHPGTTLLTVAADYSGTQATAYLTAFAGKLDPRVVVMWTGTKVISERVTAADAQAYARIVKRKVLLWDNYPANDLTGNIFGIPVKLHLGPYRGRTADLSSALLGVVANPMNEAQASKLGLFEVARFLNDPTTYDPEKAWQAAVRELGGPAWRELRLLADNTRSSILDRNESPTFVRLAKALWDAWQSPDWFAPWQSLVAELDAESKAPAGLRASRFNPGFLSEAAPWIDRLETNAVAGTAAAQTLSSMRPHLEAHGEPTANAEVVRISGHAAGADPAGVTEATQALAPAEVQMRADYHSVHGDRFAPESPTEGVVFFRENLMDEFVDRVHDETTTWAPTASQASQLDRVEVEGHPVPVGDDGSFSVELPMRERVRVVAYDAAGGATGIWLSLPGPDATPKATGPTVGGRDIRTLPATGTGREKAMMAAAFCLLGAALIRGLRRPRQGDRWQTRGGRQKKASRGSYWFGGAVGSRTTGSVGPTARGHERVRTTRSATRPSTATWKAAEKIRMVLVATLHGCTAKSKPSLAKASVNIVTANGTNARNGLWYMEMPMICSRNRYASWMGWNFDSPARGW